MVQNEDPLEHLKRNLHIIEKTLGVTFTHKELLLSAFIHSSYINEHKNLPYTHNERLEFLGDAVLNLIVGELLFKAFPETPEGELSSLRSMAVSSSSCLSYVESLGLGQFVLMGRGEKIHGSKGHVSILADHFEAVLGAVYLECGFDKSREFFLNHFEDILGALIKSPTKNWKAELQHYVQKEMKAVPQYLITDQAGPDHEKQFTVGVYVKEQRIGIGSGSSKKEAAQEAARNALLTIQARK